MSNIDDTVGKLARVYDSATDTWIPLSGVPVPHLHEIQDAADVDISEPLIEGQGLIYSTSASAFINQKIQVSLEIISSSGSYTLELSDANNLVEMSSGGSLIIPAFSSVEFESGTQITVLQTSASQVTIVGDSGVTLNGTPGLKLRDQWSGATIINRSQDVWVAIGDLTE